MEQPLIQGAGTGIAIPPFEAMKLTHIPARNCKVNFHDLRVSIQLSITQNINQKPPCAFKRSYMVPNGGHLGRVEPRGSMYPKIWYLGSE